MKKPEEGEGGRSRDELLAGEYVLGVLSHSARAQVEARVGQDRHFAAIVARWQENLADFNDEYNEEIPPPQVLARIEKQLFPEKSFADHLAIRSHWWNSLHLWRGLTAASLAALVTYVSFQTGWIGTAPPSRMLVAQMQGGDGAALGLLARYDTGNGRLQLMPVAAGASEARSLQLWLVPDGGDAPVSLGILPQTGNGVVEIPAEIRPSLTNGVTFAISVEPSGGSPTGQPTGPVIATGRAEDI